MKEHGGSFEHNSHGLRVVDVLEKRYPAFDGLNLTYEVREGFVRHRTSYDSPREAGGEFPSGEQVHLEGQVVNAADSIAYDTHDLDDGLVSGLLEEEQLRSLAVWRRAEETAGDDAGGLGAKMRRHMIVRRLIDLQATDIVRNTARVLEEAKAGSPEDVRGAETLLVGMSGSLGGEIRELEAFLHESLYRHHRVMRMANKAKRFVEKLFQEFYDHPEDLPADHVARIEGDGLAQVVCDYIAGMTDRYAQDAYRKLFQPFERM